MISIFCFCFKKHSSNSKTSHEVSQIPPTSTRKASGWFGKDAGPMLTNLMGGDAILHDFDHEPWSSLRSHRRRLASGARALRLPISTRHVEAPPSVGRSWFFLFLACSFGSRPDLAFRARRCLPTAADTTVTFRFLIPVLVLQCLLDEIGIFPTSSSIGLT